MKPVEPKSPDETKAAAVAGVANSLLTSTTRVERLNKILNRLEADTNRAQDEVWERTSRIRVEIVKEQWAAAASATELAAYLGTSDSSVIRKFALAMAPDAEHLALVNFQEPVLETPQTDLNQVRSERLAQEGKVRHAEMLRIFEEKTSLSYVYAEPAFVESKLKLLMLALDRLSTNLESELRDRGVVVGSHIRVNDDSISNSRNVAEKPHVRSTFFLESFLLDTTIGTAVVGATAIGETFLPNGPKDLNSAFASPAVIAESALYVGALFAAARGQIRGNRDNVKRRALKALDQDINGMVAAVLLNSSGQPKRSIHVNLDKEATGDIENMIDGMLDAQRQIARLILPKESRLDIASAYRIAANVLWDNAVADALSAQKFERGLER